MSRFNTRGARPAAQSPVKAAGAATTYEGAAGHARDARGELFLLAVSNMVGKDTFYERGGQRDDRFTQLVRHLAVEDPAWTAALLRWLRSTAHMRSAALVGAAEYVKGRLDAAGSRPARPHETAGRATGAFEGDHLGYSAYSNRRVIDSVLMRADEPGEMLAYWTARYGRRVPKPVKRGVADAVARLYTQRPLLKYDTESRGYRFGDVLELVHASPSPERPWQGDLYEYAIDRRHGRDKPVPAGLEVVARREGLLRMPVGVRRQMLLEEPERLLEAGFTWESLAGWLQGPMDRVAWEAIIPAMGYMALLRNLRNFDEVGVSDEVAARVAAKLADPQEVASARQFPFRLWAAYKAAPSLRWGHALERALGASLRNVPALGGRTLVLVDRSPSMFPGFHFSTPNNSDVPLADQAAVFGAAVALRAADATLVEFGRTSREVPVRAGVSLLRLVEQFGQIDGTDIPSAVKQHLKGHDRVVIVTDEQTQPGWLPSNCGGGYYGGMLPTRIDDLVPRRVPVYMWNMAGYKAGAAPSGEGNRHAFGGLTDAAFRLVALIEAGREARWQDLFSDAG
jgi:hypothetical protein